MSWLYSQVLVEEYLGDISLDGEQSVQSNGNPTQQAYLSQDKMTKFSRLSRFGMTYKPLTENLGEELLTLYLGDFHAKICQQQIKEEMDLTVNDQECGKKWHGLLAKFDQDTFLWKTLQCSLITDSQECLEIFPKWGSMQNGALWEQIPLVRHIEGTDFGWLPTPVATDFMTGKLNGIEYRNKRFIRTSLTSGTEFGAKLADAFRLITGNALPPNFSEWMMGLPAGWTELKPVGTPKYQLVQQKHGES
jgi:hypothetical protein